MNSQDNSEVFFIEKAGTVVEFYSTSPSYLTVSGQPYGTIGAGKYAYWGSDNQMPERILKLVYGNDLKPQLIKKRVNFNCGRGIITYKDQLNPDTGKRQKVLIVDHVINEWLERNNYNKVMRAIDKDLETFANAFLEVVLTNGKEVHSVKKIDATNVRAELIDLVTGRINNYFICSDWKYAKADRITQVPAFDPSYPTYHKKFILHIKEEISGQPYYGIPSWIGSEDATEVANTIWKFHKAGLKNGYALRYHIKIPNSYFDSYTDQKEKEKKKAELRESMNSWLSGAENVGKAFVSFTKTLQGVNTEEWKIETISPDLKDTAFNALFEQTTISNSRSHGIHPILGGIQLSGRLGSGSEIRSLYHAHIALETNEPRDLLTEPLRIFSKINGWDQEVKYGVEDIEFTTLDENPTGQQNAIK